jgi:hypothetical protein
MGREEEAIHADKIIMITENDIYIEAELFTTTYLGKEEMAISLLNALLRRTIPYVPEKWGTDGRPRYGIDLNDLSPVIEEWVAPMEFKSFLFARKRPAKAEMWLNIDRFERAKFNRFSTYISDRYFKKIGQEKELLDLITDICVCMNGVYGFIAHKTQASRQSPALTPAERLPGIYWANFFGQPYIDFFGRKKLLATPCYEVREINENMILLLTAESPLRPEMLEYDDIPNLIKAYLNQNAFAGPRFPDEPCEVPKFDFSDLRPKTETLVEAPDQKSGRIVAELEARGYKLVNRSQDQLTFRGKDNSVVILNLKTGNISLDITGTH